MNVQSLVLFVITDEAANDDYHRSGHKHVVAPRFDFRRIQSRANRQDDQPDD